MILQMPILNPAPIPQRGDKMSRDEQRQKAAMFRDLLIDLLNEHGPLKAAQLVALTGSKLSTVREYMSKLTHEGRAISTHVPAPGNGGAGWVAMYSAGDGLAPLKGECAKQRTLTKYPLHHVRDELVAALFGAARA